MSEEQNIQEQPTNNSLRSTENENISEDNIQHNEENMEVHKHPHHITHKKKWTEYLLEFFMIFFAVTMGFFAESIREHFQEQKSVRQYLQTYRQELVRNKAINNDEQKFLTNQLSFLDSLIIIFDTQKENQNLKTTNSFFTKTVAVFTPGVETAAYQQMVNAGGLKIIDNINFKDFLALYMDHIDKYKAYNSYINNQLSNTFPEVAKIIDVRSIIKNDSTIALKPFSIHDEKDRNTIVFFFSDVEDQYINSLKMIKNLDYINNRLIEIINKELKD